MIKRIASKKSAKKTAKKRVSYGMRKPTQYDYIDSEKLLKKGWTPISKGGFRKNTILENPNKTARVTLNSFDKVEHASRVRKGKREDWFTYYR